MILFMLVQTVYWLALSVWFGGLMFISIIWPIVYRTIADAHPNLPTVLSVNLENQHASLLASDIIANILRFFSRIQLACAAAIFITLIAQWAVMDLNASNKLHAIIRCALFVAAALLILYDRYGIWPKLMLHRQTYIDHADEPDIANPAKDQFDKYQQESMRILAFQIVLLSLIIIFSGVITPHGNL
jgi:hypothetical protein